MTTLLQFEKNIEDAVAFYFDQNNMPASPSRKAVNLADSHIQILFEYAGALEETRQHIAGHFEYNTHQGTLSVVVHTFRNKDSDHNERLGKVRKLLLNHNNGLAVENYKFLDLQPQQAMTTELAEANVDSTNLMFLVRYEIDFAAL